MGGIGPGADLGQAGGEHIDLAIGAVEPLQMSVEPVIGQMAGRAGQVQENRPHETGMGVDGDLAEIRQAAGIPQTSHARHGGGAVADFRVGGEQRQGAFINRFAGPFQRRMVGRFGQ